MKLKQRDSWLCNAKALLILCVVFGHALERELGWSTAAEALYRMSYLFHMPLFAFLSGMGAQTPERCLRQAGRMLRLYLPAQGICVLAALLWRPELAAGLLVTPVWILWYPLSLALWCLLAAGAGRLAGSCGRTDIVRTALFLLALLLGLAAGGWDAVGRAWSLSRTLVFFPCFLAGQLWGWRGMAALARSWRLRLALLLLSLPALCACWRALAEVEVRFLYQADSYAALSLPLARGLALRLAYYLAAAALSAVFLSLCPRGRVFFTPLGNETLPVFLCHPVFTGLLRCLPYPVALAVPVSALCAVAAAGAIYLAARWSQPLVRYRRPL